ncbi:unnamed protein product [Sphenostylis stenocarpa]|uniref:Sec20 C-terminal domain-containing protein n=1 Tax=Sphenostylis stenocarpa TaxID=92480 RepID=A0AA86VK86_9FABA|nr:unnamed protein product [Sphenostylis stenocarpa]
MKYFGPLNCVIFQDKGGITSALESEAEEGMEQTCKKTQSRDNSNSRRELFFGGGEESTAGRHNLHLHDARMKYFGPLNCVIFQDKGGMTSALESVTENLRRLESVRESLLRLVQEAERNTSTLIDESTGVLKKTESEYKGHRSLLSRTRNLLSVMQRQDVMDRKVTEAINAGMVGQAELRPQAVADDLNLYQVRDDHVHNIEAPLEQRIHDEL